MQCLFKGMFVGRLIPIVSGVSGSWFVVLLCVSLSGATLAVNTTTTGDGPVQLSTRSQTESPNEYQSTSEFTAGKQEMNSKHPDNSTSAPRAIASEATYASSTQAMSATEAATTTAIKATTEAAAASVATTIAVTTGASASSRTVEPEASTITLADKAVAATSTSEAAVTSSKAGSDATEASSIVIAAVTSAARTINAATNVAEESTNVTAPATSAARTINAATNVTDESSNVTAAALSAAKTTEAGADLAEASSNVTAAFASSASPTTTRTAADDAINNTTTIANTAASLTGATTTPVDGPLTSAASGTFTTTKETASTATEPSSLGRTSRETLNETAQTQSGIPQLSNQSTETMPTVATFFESNTPMHSDQPSSASQLNASRWQTPMKQTDSSLAANLNATAHTAMTSQTASMTPPTVSMTSSQTELPVSQSGIVSSSESSTNAASTQNISPTTTPEDRTTPTQSEPEESAEMRLFRDLFESYETNARPVKDSSSPVLVDVDYVPVRIINIDEKLEQYSMFGWINMYWTDEYLQWNTSEYNVDYLVVPADDIWLPDICIRNSAGKLFDDILDHTLYRVLIFPNGSVNYYTGGVTTLFCQMDIKFYPFDLQSCYLHLSSWASLSNQLKIGKVHEHMSLAVFANSGQWILSETTVEAKTEVFTGNASFDAIMFNFFFTRKPLYFSLNLVLPCTLLSCIILFVFLLPPDSGEKVGLSITVLLSFTVYQVMLADIMPDTSDVVPLLTIYVTFVMFLSFLSLLGTMFILIFQFQGGESEPPICLKIVVLNFLARILCMKKGCCKSRPTEDASESEDRKEGDKQSKFKTTLREVSTTNIVMDIVHDDVDSENETKFENGDDANCDIPEIWICEKGFDGKEPESSMGSSMPVLAVLKPSGSSSLEEEEEEKEEAAKEQWQEIARVFDRLFLIVFGVCTIILLFVVFGVAPLKGKTFHEPIPVL